MRMLSMEGVGKVYDLRVAGQGLPLSLRETMTSMFRNAKPLTRRPRLVTEQFWALKDLSFDIAQGEVVGIVGRNGAGKSTLLKLLTRITEPTVGRIRVKGRVASLLEVGTGFHPELSGRENIYLNGSILGMRRAEITSKLDAIVDFAEIERFLDTPVKRYSSGMYVRLAFAVAAHLEPDVLLVDEVLAVGDAAFQKKCLGKMGEATKHGRTVLFVSHNTAAVSMLCNRCLLLTSGHLTADGPTSEVLSAYRASFAAAPGETLANLPRAGTGDAVLESLVIEARDEAGNVLPVARPGCDLHIEIGVRSLTQISGLTAAVIIYDAHGYRLVDINTALRGYALSLETGQQARVSFAVHDLLLQAGEYGVGLWLGRLGMDEADAIDHASTLAVSESPGTVQSSIVFPGPYACRFDAEVEYPATVTPQTLPLTASTR